jgi:enamine deaminase RidA (YjgF/YER057c/UK114 family)
MAHPPPATGTEGYLLRKTSPPVLWSKGRISQIAEVRGARMIYMSGQVPADERYVVHSADFRDQAHKVFDNIEAGLATVGAGLEHIAKMTTFITDETDIPALREVRAVRLGKLASPPCNTLLVVKRLAEPEFKIEIEIVAAVPLDEVD